MAHNSQGDEYIHTPILNGTSRSGYIPFPLSFPNSVLRPCPQRHNQTVQMKRNLERRGEIEAVPRV